jgi:hypothetical protein
VHFAVAGSRRQAAAVLSDGFRSTTGSVVLKPALAFGKKMGHHHRPRTLGYMGLMTSSFSPATGGAFLAPSDARGLLIEKLLEPNKNFADFFWLTEIGDGIGN